MGDTDLALYEVKLRALFAGLYTQARSSKQRVNYKIAAKELLQFCKTNNVAANKDECKSILKSRSTEGKIKFEEFFYCFKKVTGLGDCTELPTLHLDISPRTLRKKSVVIDPVAQEFLITPRASVTTHEDVPKDLLNYSESYDTDSDKELSISSGGSPSSSTTDVSGLLEADAASSRPEVIVPKTKNTFTPSSKMDSFSALSLIMTMVFSILSFLLSIVIGPSFESSIRAGIIGFLLLFTSFCINRPKFYQRSIIILATIFVFWSAQIVKFGSNKLLHGM